MDSIFDLVTAPAIAGYWQEVTREVAPYLGETLWSNVKSPTTSIRSIIGSNAHIKLLDKSTNDAKVIPVQRAGFGDISINALEFKNSLPINESLQEQLTNALSANDAVIRDTILNRIFNDQTNLLRSAALRREQLRMEVLTTGTLNIGNGQTVDYGFDSSTQVHKASADWSTDGADILADLDDITNAAATDTGVELTRAIMNRKTFRALQYNSKLKASLFQNNANTGDLVPNKALVLDYLSAEYGLNIAVYQKGYTTTDVTGKAQFNPFIPDNEVILIPDGMLGNTAFAPTAEESLLATRSTAQVSVVDTGVAVSTYAENDPVGVTTKVSQKVVPTFEAAKQIHIINTTGK